MSDKTIQDYYSVGGEAWQYRGYRRMGPETVTRVNVIKVTDKSVRVEDGKLYTAVRMSKLDGTIRPTDGPDLLPAGHPLIAATLVKMQRDRTAREAVSRVYQWERNKGSIPHLNAAIEALTEYRKELGA